MATKQIYDTVTLSFMFIIYQHMNK